LKKNHDREMYVADTSSKNEYKYSLNWLSRA